ncbi:MAG: CPBP family intramembrane metalloprotease [Planctomycetaceae bacterium]|nr:CPBP family intramembrane metalloprotease [Planctomycetaceae bacterium]
MDIKAYPTIKDAVILCIVSWGMALGLSIIVGIICGILGIAVDIMLDGILEMLLRLLLLGIVILFGFIKTKQKFNDVFKFNKVSSELWRATTVFMVGFCILSSELDNIVDYFVPPPDFLIRHFESMVIEQIFFMSIISVAIIPAITEEMLFRGIILGGLKNNYSERKAVIVSALLFGLWHLNPWQFVSAFIIGLISAFICLRTGSLLLCIYIHFFNNALYVIIIGSRNTFTLTGFNTYSNGVFQPMWFDFIGIIIFIFGTILLAKGIKNFNKIKNETNNSMFDETEE